jgi:hypothetical protein
VDQGRRAVPEEEHQIINCTKYFAYDQVRKAPPGADRLPAALFDAAVDLNPHQIEAAVFAQGHKCSSPRLFHFSISLNIRRSHMADLSIRRFGVPHHQAAAQRPASQPLGICQLYGNERHEYAVSGQNKDAYTRMMQARTVDTEG